MADLETTRGRGLSLQECWQFFVNIIGSDEVAWARCKYNRYHSNISSAFFLPSSSWRTRAAFVTCSMIKQDDYQLQQSNPDPVVYQTSTNQANPMESHVCSPSQHRPINTSRNQKHHFLNSQQLVTTPNFTGVTLAIPENDSKFISISHPSTFDTLGKTLPCLLAIYILNCYINFPTSGTISTTCGGVLEMGDPQVTMAFNIRNHGHPCLRWGQNGNLQIWIFHCDPVMPQYITIKSHLFWFL